MPRLKKAHSSIGTMRLFHLFERHPAYLVWYICIPSLGLVSIYGWQIK